MTNPDFHKATAVSSIQPWITVKHGEAAATFYKSAFNAVETYRMDGEDGGLVVRLNIGGAECWISSAGAHAEVPHVPPGGIPIRMILIVSDPDTLVLQAEKAGAKIVFPVGEDHGWRLGRVEDPFGIHWEIGHEL